MQEGAGIRLPLLQLDGVNCSQLGEQVLKCIPSRRNIPALFLRDQRLSYLLPHTWTHPTPGPHSFRSIVLWRWADVSPVLTHLMDFTANGLCLEKCQLLDHKKHKERPGARGWARWQHQLLSKELCFNNCVLQTKLIKPVFLIYATVSRSKVHFHYTFDVI